MFCVCVCVWCVCVCVCMFEYERERERENSVLRAGKSKGRLYPPMTEKDQQWLDNYSTLNSEHFS